MRLAHNWVEFGKSHESAGYNLFVMGILLICTISNMEGIVFLRIYEVNV